MSDPTASFLLTARDGTAAAIASADKNFKRLSATVRGARSLFAGFGVALSGRVFMNWISGALEAKDLTEDQAKSLKGAKDAIDAFKESSDGLARSFAVNLTPAIEAASAVLTGWNALLFNADPSPFGKEIEDLRDKLKALEKQGIDTGIGFPIYSAEQQAQMAKLKADIESLRQKSLNKIMPDKQSQVITPEESARLDDFLGQMNESVNNQKPKVRELTVELTAFIDQVKRGAEVTKDMRTEAEQNIDTWHETMDLFKNGVIGPETVNRMRDSLLEPIEVTAKRLKELKPEVSEFALSLGRGLKSSLADFIVDGKARFKDFLKQLTAEIAVSALFKGIAGLAGGPAGFLAGIFGGSRANEGPVSAGKVYKVHPGEAFFQPNANGQVQHLAGAGAGGAPINLTQNNYISGVEMSKIPAVLDANNRKLKAELRDLNNRGRF